MKILGEGSIKRRLKWNLKCVAQRKIEWRIYNNHYDIVGNFYRDVRDAIIIIW